MSKLDRKLKWGALALIGGLGLIILFATVKGPPSTQAQTTPENAQEQAEPPPENNAPSSAEADPTPEPESASEAAAAPGGGTDAPGDSSASSEEEAQTAQSNAEPDANANAEAESPPDDGKIQVSFKQANIDLVIKWLAETTGKSVVKHPKVNCKLTIVSPSKQEPRDAVRLVYQALALEGFTALETSRAIMIVPENEEPKLSPSLLEAGDESMPEGRQRVLQVFELRHVKAAELQEKIKGILSDKAVVEADARANKVIVTDYAENIQLIRGLIEKLDVASVSDSVVEIFDLQHYQADELAELLTAVLNGESDLGNSSRGRSRSRGDNNDDPNAIHLWPDANTNRLIVAAPKLRLPEIERLINLLDTSKPADVAVRVLPLKHVSAEALVGEIAPLYGKMSGRSLKDMIEVTANSRSNSLIVLSSEDNFEAIQSLVQKLDTEDAIEKVMKTFTLVNADAEDVATQLQELYSDQNNSSYTRYIYYYSSRPTDSSKMSFVSDRRRNAVIVQAPPDSMPGIVETIKVLDEPVTGENLAPRIIPLKFVSAVDIEEVLNELFLRKSTQQRNYWDYYATTESTDYDVGRLYGKVRITSEPYSNSIIVTSNSPENFEAVEEIIKKLDVPSQAGDTTLRVALDFAGASNLANFLNILFAQDGSPPLRPNNQPNQPDQNRNQQQQNNQNQSTFEIEKAEEEETYYPWLGGQQRTASRFGETTAAERPVSDLVGRVRVVPDPRTNSLLITSNVHFFPQVLKLINEMDSPTPQVLIEAKIVEVSSDFRDRLGTRFSPDGSQTFDADDYDNSLIGSSSAIFTKVFSGSLMPEALKSGVLDSSINLDLLVQFLRKNTDAHVMAEPQINIADNEIGKLFVGSQVPFISGSLNTQEGGRNDSFQYRDVGIILEVTPHINNSEEVALKIRVESSSIRSGETLFGGAILDTRNFKTDLMVKSGETIVLGGIIQTEDTEIVRKVPLLGSIPVLGWAFKKRDTVRRDVELMVFLRPVITRTPEEARNLVEEIKGNTPNIRAWDEKNAARLREKEKEK